MAQGRSRTIYLSDDEWSILELFADRLKLSRSEVIRNLVIYHGLCGGDFPLTSKIISLPAADRDRVIAGVLQKAKSGEFVKPQSFRLWIKETLGSDDPAAIAQGVDALLRKLLE